MKILIEKTTNGWLEVIFINEDGKRECHYFSGEKEHIDSLNLKIKEYKITLTKEEEDLIKEAQYNFVYPDEEDIKAEKEQNRIACIKNEARLIIESKYPIFWQLNYPRGDERFVNEYLWIDKIREISNKAEEDGLEYNQIDWGI